MLPEKYTTFIFQNFRIAVVSLKKEDMEFDMIGVDPAVANAFRRILISEVPSMAIEKVYMINNTSVIQDNVSQEKGIVIIMSNVCENKKKLYIVVSDLQQIGFYSPCFCRFSSYCITDTKTPGIYLPMSNNINFVHY